MQTQIDPTLKERLAQLLSKLTPSTARKLALGLEREKLRGTSLPYEAIMSGLRPKLGKPGEKRPGCADAFRQFCIPFEDLLEDKMRSVKQQGRICRHSIQPVWNWLSRDLLPDAIADLSKRIAEHALAEDEVAMDAAIAILHSSASTAILNALELVRRDPAKRRALEQALGGEAILEDAREMAHALAIAPALRLAQASMPKPIIDFDEDLVYLARDIYRQVLNSDPDYAIYVPLAIMGRLSQPWQILRLAKKIVRQSNEAMISQTELSVLGEIPLRRIEDIATRYASQRAGDQNLEMMLEETVWSGRASKGLTSELDLRRFGEWGQRLLAARARLSTAVSDELSRFEHEIAVALPLHKVGMYGRSGPRRPDLTGAPQSEPIQLMARRLHFLAGVSVVAESLGLQSHCISVRAEIDDYLNTYSDGLIEDIRLLKGPERRNAQSFLEVVCLYRDIIGPADTASILRRRGAVAAQD